jgi:hypothetical protein
MTTYKKQTDSDFGLCPQCHCHDGFINVGRDHWFVCDEHKVRWLGGSNLFSGWREQTKDEQRRIYNERGIGEYAKIKPYNPQAEYPALFEDQLRVLLLTEVPVGINPANILRRVADELDFKSRRSVMEPIADSEYPF